MESWGRRRIDDLARLADAALPGEDLTPDELEGCCWEGGSPSIVLGRREGDAAIAAVVRDEGGRRIGYVQFVAVAPAARRRGFGRELVAAACRWAFDDHGVEAVRAGGGAPFYLWAGVDVHALAALCLFEAAGFRPVGAALNLSFPAHHRAPSPLGVELRRALSDADAAAAVTFVGDRWPGWVAETSRAIEHGACHLAVSGTGAVVGFGCHSVNRAGWLGPMGTDRSVRSSGVGNALLGAIAADLMAAGLESVEVSWIGPVRFYAKAAGATVSRVFRTLELTR